MMLFIFLFLILNARADVCDIVWGTFVSGEPWLDDKMAATIRKDNALDRSSYIVHWYANWGDGSGDFGWNIPYHLNIIRNFTSIGNSEHIPLISWQPFAPHVKFNHFHTILISRQVLNYSTIRLSSH